MKKAQDHPSSPKLLGGKLLDAVDFCVIDCEMTGLDPDSHEIIAIGAVRISGGKICMNRRFYRLVKPPQVNMSRENVLIHRIRHQALEDGVSGEDAIASLRSFCGVAVLVGHHIGLDLQFLNSLAKKSGQEPFLAPALDTQAAARWHLRFSDRHRPEPSGADLQLSNLCVHYKTPFYRPHHAFFDALATACLFRKQWDLFHRAGYYTYGDLHKIAGVNH